MYLPHLNLEMRFLVQRSFFSKCRWQKFLGFFLAGMCLFGSVSLAQTFSSTATTYRVDVREISLNPASGETALPNYLVKFGIFRNGFVPTAANLAQWDSNFSGVTASYSGNVVSTLLFTSNNSVYPVGAQFYVVAYNIAPTAPISTATKGIVLTRPEWTAGEAVVRGSWQNYWYQSTGLGLYRGDNSEDNSLPASDPAVFSSPINTITPTPLSGSFAGRFRIGVSFDMTSSSPPSAPTTGFAAIYNDPLASASTRTDGPWNLGMKFRTGPDPVTVTALGAQDGGRWLASSIRAGLWSGDGSTLLAEVNVASTRPQEDGGYRFAPITPVTLAANTEYIVGALGGTGYSRFLDGDNTSIPYNRGNSAIEIVNSTYNDAAGGFSAPTWVAGGGVGGFRWGFANFKIASTGGVLRFQPINMLGLGLGNFSIPESNQAGGGTTPAGFRYSSTTNTAFYGGVPFYITSQARQVWHAGLAPGGTGAARSQSLFRSPPTTSTVFTLWPVFGGGWRAPM